MPDEKKIKDMIYSTFSEIVNSIGYSPVHGKILAALFVNNGELSLQELAKETGYSSSMISLSLDFLEIFGIIKKRKKPQDRNLYIKLQGDLLECLKNAIIIKVKKSIDETLNEFEKNKKDISKLSKNQGIKAQKTLKILEKEIKRLKKYIDMLSEIKPP